VKQKICSELSKLNISYETTLKFTSIFDVLSNFIHKHKL